MGWLRTLGIGSVLCVCTSAAQGQEVLGDVGLAGAPLFTAQDVEVLDQAAKLTPEQREAIENLLHAAMTQAAVADHAFDEKWYGAFYGARESKDPAKKSQAALTFAEAVKTLHASVVPVERQTLIDVRGTLTPDQSQKAWTTYEGYRRTRVIGSWATIVDYGRATPPRELIRQLKLSEADLAAAEAILDESAPALDAILGRMIIAGRATNKARSADSVAMGRQLVYRGRAEEVEQDEVEKDLKKVQTELAAEYLRICGRMANRFSPEGRRALQHKRIDAESMEYALTQNWAFTGQMASWYIRQCKSLTPEQKRALKDLTEAANVQIRDLLVPDLASRDAALLGGEKWTPDEKRVAAFSEAAEKIRKQLDKDLRSVLTTEQVSEVDHRRPSPAKLRKIFYSRGVPGELTEEDE